jgi:hypothetical protein
METDERTSSMEPAGVMAMACTHRRPDATREPPAVIAVRINWQLARELQAFPDLHMTVVKTVAENDLVTTLWIFRGTHARNGYGGFPPTGTYMEFRGITIFRVVDGRIVEEWTTFNSWSAYSQALQHLRWWIIAAVCLLLLAWLYIGHLVFKWLGRSRKPVPVG